MVCGVIGLLPSLGHLHPAPAPRQQSWLPVPQGGGRGEMHAGESIRKGGCWGLEEHRVRSGWEGGHGGLAPSYPSWDGPAPALGGVRPSRVVRNVKVGGEVRYTQGISKALRSSWDVWRKPDLSESHGGSLKQ